LGEKGKDKGRGLDEDKTGVSAQKRKKRKLMTHVKTGGEKKKNPDERSGENFTGTENERSENLNRPPGPGEIAPLGKRSGSKREGVGGTAGTKPKGEGGRNNCFSLKVDRKGERTDVCFNSKREDEPRRNSH